MDWYEGSIGEAIQCAKMSKSVFVVVIYGKKCLIIENEKPVKGIQWRKTRSGWRVSESDVKAHEGALAITETQITDLGSYLELVSAPSTSKGASGDAAGDVAMDNDYIYRCTANYTDGNADIWKRVEFSTDTW